MKLSAMQKLRGLPEGLLVDFIQPILGGALEFLGLMTQKSSLHPWKLLIRINAFPVLHVENTLRKNKFLHGQMSDLGCCIRASRNVKVIHFFWHLPSKMLQISIVISFSEPVRDYRLHLHDVWCVCFYGIKWLTFKLEQLLMLEGREWCFLPPSSHTALTFCSLQKKSQHMKWKKGNTSVRGKFSLFMPSLKLNHDVCFVDCALWPSLAFCFA